MVLLPVFMKLINTQYILGGVGEENLRRKRGISKSQTEAAPSIHKQSATP